MGSTDSTGRVWTEGTVRIIAIDRPEVKNAVDRPTADALFRAFVDFDADDSVVAAVLTGQGDTFCAGADLGAVATGRGNRVTPDGPGPMGPTRLQTTKPVIAAVEGYAVAGGLELAIWADLRVAGRTATFGVYCRRWGVPLIDGGTVRLPRLIGQSRAMDMVLTGRGVSGDEAVAMGLVNRLVDDGTALAEAIALAQSLAVFPQGCLRSDRRSVLEQWGLNHDAAMAKETELGMAVISSGETQAGAARFSAGEGRHGAFRDA
ncbi:MAG: crotonase/enoyl-CoA hydratase family protein [Acidimicrobiales bacterium]